VNHRSYKVETTILLDFNYAKVKISSEMILAFDLDLSLRLRLHSSLYEPAEGIFLWIHYGMPLSIFKDFFEQNINYNFEKF